MSLLEKDFNYLLKLIKEKKNFEFEKKINFLISENKNSFLLQNILGLYYKVNNRVYDSENAFKNSIYLKENSDAYNNIGLIKTEKKKMMRQFIILKKQLR